MKCENCGRREGKEVEVYGVRRSLCKYCYGSYMSHGLKKFHKDYEEYIRD